MDAPSIEWSALGAHVCNPLAKHTSSNRRIRSPIWAQSDPVVCWTLVCGKRRPQPCTWLSEQFTIENSISTIDNENDLSKIRCTPLPQYHCPILNKRFNTPRTPSQCRKPTPNRRLNTDQIYLPHPTNTMNKVTVHTPQDKNLPLLVWLNDMFVHHSRLSIARSSALLLHDSLYDNYQTLQPPHHI